MLLAKKLNKGAGTPAALVDAQFNQVTMLLHGDGTNGAQNNTFIDSSTNAFSITRNGNTTQGSFSPYGSNWSNFFDGNGDYLTCSVSVPATGAFTVEMFVFPTSTAGYQLLFSQFTSGNAGSLQILWDDTTDKFTVNIGTGTVLTSTSTYALNTWHHLAITRNGSNNMTMWVNGASAATTTNSTSILQTTTYIASRSALDGYFNGYISNLRVTNTAVYTTGFTPSTTPLTAISGTALLTCQSNRFVDNSASPKTITLNGNTSVQRFNPFGTSTAYSTSVIGGSAYFDGASDYLKTTGTVGIANSAFTICCWFYPLNSSVIGLFDSGPDVAGVFRNFDANRIEYQLGGTPVSIAGDYQVNAWNWLCITKSTTTFDVYINGTSAGSGTCASTMVESNFTIGAINNGGDGSYLGYISDFQVLNTATIVSVPTAPITNASGKTYLLKFQNAAIFDNAMMNDLETVGNAQISTSVKKYGTGSLAFDGTGDYLVPPASPNNSLGSGNFTIECWVNPSIVNNNAICGLGNVDNTDTSCFFLRLENGYVNFYTTGNNRYAVTYTSGSWYHLAVVRSSGTVSVYWDGTQIGSGISITNNFSSTDFYVACGKVTGTIPYNAFNGYIDDLRITKGYARYTATFTPPTSALSDTGPY
jgi:hypothetical protein